MFQPAEKQGRYTFWGGLLAIACTILAVVKRGRQKLYAGIALLFCTAIVPMAIIFIMKFPVVMNLSWGGFVYIAGAICLGVASYISANIPVATSEARST